MGFVDKEMDGIALALRDGAGDEKRYDQLYGAQQALKWATDPQGYASPLAMIENELVHRVASEASSSEATADCSAETRPLPS